MTLVDLDYDLYCPVKPASWQNIFCPHCNKCHACGQEVVKCKACGKYWHAGYDGGCAVCSLCDDCRGDHTSDCEGCTWVREDSNEEV